MNERTKDFIFYGPFKSIFDVIYWRFINEKIEEQIDFGSVAAQQTINTVNFGGI